MNIPSEAEEAGNTVTEFHLGSMKIGVLTGSPRRNGNSFAMTDAFIKAAALAEKI